MRRSTLETIQVGLVFQQYRMLEQKFDHPVINLMSMIVHSPQAYPLEKEETVRHLRNAGPPGLQSHEDVEVGFELAFS